MQSSSQIANKPTPSFFQAGCPSCRLTNSVRALKGKADLYYACTKHVLTCELAASHCPCLKAHTMRGSVGRTALACSPTVVGEGYEICLTIFNVPMTILDMGSALGSHK